MGIYCRLQEASASDNTPLDESSGRSLTHGILSRLGLRELERDNKAELEAFEENCERLQSRMIPGSPGTESPISESEWRPYAPPKIASVRHDP
jgi:hypothetical protein